MNPVWVAFSLGLVSAVSLPLGAMTSFLWRFDSRVIAAMMAFGGGALLAALTIDMVAPALALAHYAELFAGFLLGGLLFILLNLLVNDLGGFRRKISTSLHQTHRTTRRRIRRILPHLHRTRIFHGLSREELKQLAGAAQPRFYPRGSELFREGDPSENLYIVVEGEVEFSVARGQGHGETGAAPRVRADDAFGTDSLLTGSPHYHTATAVEPTWCWCIPEAGLRRLLAESPELQHNIRHWLQQPETRNYLIDRQGMATQEAETWLEEACETLRREGRLPDARPVERQAESFRDIAGQLDRMPWLEDLSEEEADRLSLHLVYRKYRAGEILFAEGTPSDRLFILEDGGITLADADNRLMASRYDAGDGIGVRSFLTGVRHTVTARASRDCGAWSLRREDFQRLLATYPDIGNRLGGYLRSPSIRAYLRQRYQLDGGRIEGWVSQALKAVSAGKAPPSLLLKGVESSKPTGAATAVWLGILLDGIPESLVIGASLGPAGISLSLIVGLFLANYPEALSSSQGMLDEKFSRRRILLMWSSITLLTGVGAALGKLVVDASGPAFLPFLEGLGAGAMLTMIAQTMLPEAYLKGGSIIGLCTMMGFLCAISMKIF